MSRFVFPCCLALTPAGALQKSGKGILYFAAVSHAVVPDTVATIACRRSARICDFTQRHDLLLYWHLPIHDQTTQRSSATITHCSIHHLKHTSYSQLFRMSNLPEMTMYCDPRYGTPYEWDTYLQSWNKPQPMQWWGWVLLSTAFSTSAPWE